MASQSAPPANRTPDEVRERIIALRQWGVSPLDIIAATGIGERTVYRILRNAALGRDNGPLSLEDLEKAWLMLDDGVSYAEVARTIGRPYSVIRRELPGYEWSDEQVMEHLQSMRKLKRKALKGI